MDKLHSGELYLPGDDELQRKQLECLEKLYDFNMTRPSESEKRKKYAPRDVCGNRRGLLYRAAVLCQLGWGGRHVHFGDRVYANFGLTMVDDTHIYVGDDTMFGPNVTIATAGYPILPCLRLEKYKYNAEIHIGKNCWIGAGTVIVPGVSIGDGSVIGAGSVVTRDVPSGVVAFGDPCRVRRPIDEHDREFYFRDKRIPAELTGKKTTV